MDSSLYGYTDEDELEHLETELKIENIKDPDDWEWYYGTMSKSELLNIVRKQEAPNTVRKQETLSTVKKQETPKIVKKKETAW